MGKKGESTVFNLYDRATEITKEAGLDPTKEGDRFKACIEYMLQFDKHLNCVRPLPPKEAPKK